MGGGSLDCAAMGFATTARQTAASALRRAREKRRTRSGGGSRGERSVRCPGCHPAEVWYRVVGSRLGSQHDRGSAAGTGSPRSSVVTPAVESLIPHVHELLE